MKTKKFFIVPVLALLAVSCQEELQEGGTTPQLATGNEVTFGATLGESTLTRTSYGALENGEYPIYWEDGDEVIVTSPDCGVQNTNGGVGMATYSVSVASDTQSYATDLIKTGDIGVRWGENETGTFYSVYPAENASFGTDYTTVTLTMPQQQNCTVDDGTVYPNMDACFMYAKTEGVNNGEKVNLRYIPISTAIRFTLTGPSDGTVTVSSINFRAPSGTSICGTFKVDLSSDDINGEAAPQTMSAESGYNAVSVVAQDANTHGYLTLSQNETADMNVFLLLEKETDVSSGWTIEVKTADGTTYTKTLSLEGGSTLVPGKVHNLPALPALSKDDWDVSNWMTNIPRNVYLSEISIPGSWNSVNSDYQRATNGTDIEVQYNNGIRAFHLDTRWKGSLTYGFIFSNGYNVTGLGVADGSSGDAPTLNDEGRILTSNSSPTFNSILSQLVELVAEDEYMVVMCTFAQDSYDYNRSSGGWEAEISSICANYNDVVVDAKELNQNSVVADVLGKIIVIINSENTFTSLTSSLCLFFNMGMTLDQSEFTGSDYYQRKLYYGSGSESGITMYGTHANISSTGTTGSNTSSRGYAPSLTERQTKAGNILTWSKNNYDNQDDYAHDAWIYLGLGGYTSDDAAGYNNVASTLNGWIDDQITEMDENGYYPVGLVFMNNVTSYTGVVEDILMLNNKYVKAYDESRSSIDGSYLDGSGTTTSVSSAATGYSSGMKDNNTNAINWD